MQRCLPLCKMSQFRRSYASWGMGGLWDRLRDGFGRSTESIIEKKKRMQTIEKSDITKDTNTKDTVKKTGTTIMSPWERMEEAKKKAKHQDEGPLEELWMRSPFVRGSDMKLNMMARQIINLPLDAAILQMHFSKRKMSKVVLELLTRMKSWLISRRANANYYFVKSASVGRGTYLKRLDIKGRGRMGIQNRGHAFIRVGLYKPDPVKLVKKMLRIKGIPTREDTPIVRKIDYN